jgi:hypothetical protein
MIWLLLVILLIVLISFTRGGSKKNKLEITKLKTEIEAQKKPTPVNVSDELLKLSELKEKGILSNDEYERQKYKLLNK